MNLQIKIKRYILLTITTFIMASTNVNTVLASEVDLDEPPSWGKSDKLVERKAQAEIKDGKLKASKCMSQELVKIIEVANKSEVISSKGEQVLIDLPNVEKIEEELKKREEILVKQIEFDKVVKEVIAGNYGNGEARREKLLSEGHDYLLVQAKVKELMPEPVVEVEPTETRMTSRSVAAPVQKSGNVIKAYPHNTFKSYMRWTALSSSSAQGKLVAQATKDPSTAIMMYQGRYLVALGFAYANHIGEHIDIVMESGQVIPVIVGDWKAKAHTDQWNSASTNNGSIIEFIVSSNKEANAAVNGSGNYNAIFPGLVKEFRK